MYTLPQGRNTSTHNERKRAMAFRPGLHDLYSCDPGHADEQIWGRRSNPLTRRGFLIGSWLAAMSAVLAAAAALAARRYRVRPCRHSGLLQELRGIIGTPPSWCECDIIPGWAPMLPVLGCVIQMRGMR